MSGPSTVARIMENAGRRVLAAESRKNSEASVDVDTTGMSLVFRDVSGRCARAVRIAVAVQKASNAIMC